MLGLCRGILFCHHKHACERVDVCVCARVCARTGKRRADTTLSVVLMVPLTTQQLLHIDVVLAVGLKLKDTHTESGLHMHPLKSAVMIKRASWSLCLFSPTPCLSSFSVMAEFTYGSCRPTHTHPAVHTEHLHLPAFPHLLRVCLHVSCQSSVTCSLIELSMSGPCCIEGTPT